MPSRRFTSKQLNYQNPYFHKESPQEKNIRHKKLFSFFALIVVSGLVYLTVYSPIFRLPTTQIEAIDSDNSYYVKESINAYLEGNRGLVIPNNNWLLLSTDKLKEHVSNDIENKFSVEYITINKRSWKKIVVDYKERTATIICKTTKGDYYIDNRGVIVSQYITPEETDETTEPDNSFPILHWSQDSTSTIGEEVVQQKTVESLLEIYNAFPDRFADLEIDYFENIEKECYVPKTTEKDFEIIIDGEKVKDDEDTSDDESEEIVTSYVCPESNPYEYSIVTQSDLKIHFTAEQPYAEQLNSLYLTINEKIKSNIDSISYIDLRYLPRIYYK
ncbi:hypothetical protein KKG41_05375 [Patescibacteria group bacterium]|nr:hypothetical protein [Patescibacteria group bacterium]MBU1890151.1 hypothetical protein [Patescibacteria group bacterium]